MAEGAREKAFLNVLIYKCKRRVVVWNGTLMHFCYDAEAVGTDKRYHTQNGQT